MTNNRLIHSCHSVVTSQCNLLSSLLGRVRISRHQLPVLVVIFTGLTLLIATHHEDPGTESLSLTDVAKSTIDIQVDGSSHSLILVRNSSDASRLTIVDNVDQLTRTSHQSNAVNQDIIRKVIQTQGSLIPIVGNRTSDKYRATPQQIQASLDLLDRKIEADKKFLRTKFGTTPDFWNTTQPKKLLIVTSWRSGSTFVGSILSSHLSVFYHYEPLMYAGTHQIRDGKPAQVAIRHLSNLFRCEFSNSEYLRAIKGNTRGMIRPNIKTWNACFHGPNVNACREADYLSQACHKFPFILAKVVRLRLRLVRDLLDDPNLNDLKIVYLVRDPRATINSRIGVIDWCGKSEDCINPRLLCSDIGHDLDAMEQLRAAYPDRFLLVQYETLAHQPQNVFQQIFQFAGLSFLPSIRQTIYQHTTKTQGNAWATYRKSSDRIDLWKTQLERDKIDFIQDVCSDVLTRLGYPLL